MTNSRTEWDPPRFDDVVVGGVLLKNEPYRFDVLGGKAPVALGVKVAEIKEFFLARFYAGESAGDFPGNECLAAAGRFVVEEDAIASEEIVAFAVVASHPVSINLQIRTVLACYSRDERFFLNP
jgi:hypothetical protein